VSRSAILAVRCGSGFYQGLFSAAAGVAWLALRSPLAFSAKPDNRREFLLAFSFCVCYHALELLPGAAPAKVANSSQISLWRSGETQKGLQPKKAAIGS
jgi:hypothetical protein